MTRQTTRWIAALWLFACVAAGTAGCGKTQVNAAKLDTPEQQQQRKEKAGD